MHLPLNLYRLLNGYFYNKNNTVIFTPHEYFFKLSEVSCFLVNLNLNVHIKEQMHVFLMKRSDMIDQQQVKERKGKEMKGKKKRWKRIVCKTF